MGAPDDSGATDETLLAVKAAPPAEEPPPPPVVNGRYQILGLIGSAGMGTVYRARDLELDEVVALKMLRAHLVDQPDMLERFRREVKLARRVTNQNVARTFDIGEQDGEKFLSMEYIDGPSLGKICEGGRLPIPRIVDIGAQVCAGLGAAHAAGVVHRDLKPDSVLLGKDGRVVITDFGIASAWELGSSARTLGRGTPVGTPAYMAPEQVEEEAIIDARADLYALGVMLYEMATGQQPWRGSSIMKVAVARLTQPPPDPRAVAPDLPTSLAELILRLMARRPDDRPPDAASVAEALATVTHSGAVPPVATQPAISARGDKSLAALPWRNLGPPEDDYLAEALTDDLIDALSMTRGVRVRARGAVSRYRGVERDARETGRELGVEVVVECGVRRLGGGLRMNVRAIGVTDGFQLWAQRFERSAGDALTVIDEVAAAIASALTAERVAPVRELPLDPEALHLYLRARHLSVRRDPKRFGEAVELSRVALTRAPDHPVLLANHAQLLLGAWFNGGSAEEARQACERAVAAGPDRAEPRVALARFHSSSNDWVGAVVELKRAIALSPSMAEAYEMLGAIALEVGDVEHGVRGLQFAMSLDPTSVTNRSSLGRAHAFRGEWEQAEALLQQDEVPMTLGIRLRLAIWQRDLERARAIAKRLEGMADPRFFWFEKATRELLESGRVDGPEVAALKRDLAAEKGSPRRRSFGYQIVAELACFAGEPAEAMASLVASVDGGLVDLGWMDRCPLLAPLRSDAKFAELRARVAERVAPVLAALVP
jgi:serine/threonine-protein kinase